MMTGMTKNEMARTVVQALHNLPSPPRADDPRVVRRAQKSTVATLQNQYRMAVAAMKSVGKKVADSCDV